MQKNNGLSIAGVTQIVFLILKLTGLINWKWIWVFSPLWIDFCLIFLVAIILAIEGED